MKSIAQTLLFVKSAQQAPALLAGGLFALVQSGKVYLFGPEKGKHMRIKRLAALSAAAVLTVSLLAGCDLLAWLAWLEENSDSSSVTSGSSSSSSSSRPVEDDDEEDESTICTVTAKIGTGGSVTYAGNTITGTQTAGGIASGSTISFSVAPAVGYAVDAVNVTGGTLVQNGNNRYTIIVNGDCTVTVFFGEIGDGNLSQEQLMKIADTVRTVLRGDSTETEKQVEVSMISGQGWFGDDLDAPDEHTQWAKVLSTALNAGSDENTIAQTAIEAINDNKILMSVQNASLEEAALDDIKKGFKGDYLCIYKYRDAASLQSFVNERFSGLQPSDTGTNTYQLYVTIASVNDTNYAMIVLHGAYTGSAGSATNFARRLL